MKYQIISLAITMTFGENKSLIYPTLLWDKDNIILVDCGYLDSIALFEEALNKLGLSIMDLTGIVITHQDHDHLGNAAEIKRRNKNVKIYASKEETPYINGTIKPIRLQQAEEIQKTLPLDQQARRKVFIDMLKRIEPVEVDEFLYDGQKLDWCGGCTVIATPGHTPGHIALYMENDSIVITGDALEAENGVLALANPQYSLNIEQATKSVNKLLAINAKAYYCYHGGVYNNK